MIDKIYIPEEINNSEYTYYIDEYRNIIIETEANTCINYYPNYNIYSEAYTCETSNYKEINYDQIVGVNQIKDTIIFIIACIVVIMITSLIKNILGG